MISKFLQMSDVLGRINGILRKGVSYGMRDHLRRDKFPETNEVFKLLDLYGSEERLSDWVGVFKTLKIESILTWNNILSIDYGNNLVYLKHGLFRHMTQTGTPKPDQHTLCKLLSSSCELRDCKAIHGYAITANLIHSSFLNNSLIVRYSKCGDLPSSIRIFNVVKQKRFDVLSGTAMINAFGWHGMLDDVLSVFEEMNKRGIQPNERTILGVLYAYNHTGHIEEYLELFRSMHSKYGVKPNMFHFHNLVDTLCRADRFGEVEDWVHVAANIMGGTENGVSKDTMDELWRVVASHANTHSNFDMGFKAINNISELRDDDWIKKSQLEKKRGKFSEAHKAYDEVAQKENFVGKSSIELMTKK